jgi:hypothetical protein
MRSRDCQMIRSPIGITGYQKAKRPTATPRRWRSWRQYFSDRRYEFFVNTSLGHSLPVPNGCAQLPGEAYAARVRLEIVPV